MKEHPVHLKRSKTENGRKESAKETRGTGIAFVRPSALHKLVSRALGALERGTGKRGLLLGTEAWHSMVSALLQVVSTSGWGA